MAFGLCERTAWTDNRIGALVSAGVLKTAGPLTVNIELIKALTPERGKRQAAVDSIDALSRSRKAQLEKVARLSQATRIKTSGTLRQGPAKGGNAARRKLSLVAGA